MNGNRITINETLLELLLGIAAFGAVCQATVVWFVTDKTAFSTGLWFGALLAALAAAHMYWALDRALDLGEGAVGMIRKHSILRYLAIVIILGVVMVTGITNPLAVFLGYMGLKVAAYLQPFTHRCISNRKKEQ